MNFLTPNRLWSLLIVAAFIVAYIVVQRRRQIYAARLSSSEMLDSVLPKHPGWRRHSTAFIFLLAIAVMCFSWAQPTQARRVPRERATIIVAIDVSLSMQAEDVSPSRLEAAQEAANRFVDELPPSLNVGIVSFAGSASVLVSPTQDRALAHRAIDGLQLDESTAIGEAIVTSLGALETVPPDANGEVPPARIVLLSDGVTTVGRTDEEAIAEALVAKVPVSTIAFGTKGGVIIYDDPATPEVEQDIIEVPVGGDSLRLIADTTGGSFFSAESLAELDAVYNDIGSAIGYEDIDKEVTDWFAGGALALMAASGLLSMLWFQRLP